MAKRRLTGYTFDASAQTITHADFSDITLAGIQLIVNVTDQIIIYSFADTTKGGTLATDTLTLEYDTTSMSDTDELMILVEDGVASQPISASSLPLPTGASTSAKQDTIIGHLDGVEGLLTTIDADTGNISTKIDTIAGAVSGTEVQVDVLTMPTTTVQATNLDIRDLTNASDSVAIYGSDDGGTTKRIIKTDAGGAIQVDLEVASVAITSIAAGDNNIGNVDIVSSALPTGASTLAEQQTQTTHLATIAGDTTSIQTAVELIDDTVATISATKVLKVALFDNTDTQITSFGGGIQYSDADANADPTGTVSMGTDGSNIYALHTDTSGDLQVDILTSALPTGASTSANQTTIIGHLDGVEGLLTTIDADTGSILTSVDGIEALLTTIDADTSILSGLVLATQADDVANTSDGLQVTNFNMVYDGTTWDRLRGTSADGMLVNLGTNNDVVVSGTVDLGATDNAVLDAIAASVAAIDTDTTTIIGHVDGIEALLTTIDADTGNIDTSLNNVETYTLSKYITGIGHGVKTVTTAGTDEALAGSTACKKVVIQAQTDNTGVIAVGATGVDATIATGTGIILYPGDVYELEIDNLADVFIDSSVNGEGVRYNYFT